jgi:hypothetical protein
MKKILTILMIMMSITLFAQKYEYKIKLKDVTNMGEAKMVTDYLRSIFNVYPTFNDSTDFFEFKSDFYINKSGFEGYMTEEGYAVLFFDKKELIGIKEEEK